MSYLLWYDAAGARQFGLESLPGWLDAIASGAIDPKSEGKIRSERPAVALLDGQNGLAPLVLARAASVAVEKAREVGLGAVRVVNLARRGPVGAILAEVATGPMIGWSEGPGPSWGVAVPVRGTSPAVWDSDLIPAEAGSRPHPLPALLPPWALPFAEDGGWLISAQAVEGVEPLASFHARVESRLGASTTLAGEVRPRVWQAARDELSEGGLILDDAASGPLRAWADRLGIGWPSLRASDPRTQRAASGLGSRASPRRRRSTIGPTTSPDAIAVALIRSRTIATRWSASHQEIA